LSEEKLIPPLYIGRGRGGLTSSYLAFKSHKDRDTLRSLFKLLRVSIQLVQVQETIPVGVLA
jgi:hypothetical protein